MNYFSRACKCLLTAALTLSLTVGAAGAVSFGTGTVNATSLNLRSQPSTTAASLGLVAGGTTVDVLEDAINGWYRVNCGGTEGYMSADYLLVTALDSEANAEAVADGESPAEDSFSDLGNGKVTLTSGYLNIRSTPALTGDKVGSVPNGTVVALDQWVDGWYLVTYRGITGYISQDYIVLTEENVAVPTESSAVGSDVVALAMQYLGCPYGYGKSGPSSFDCSGFTSYIYGLMGYTLNRTASTQLNNNGVSVARADLQVGDLVFFRDYSCKKSASHVGIYIGEGQFIHSSSSSSKSGVKISSLYETWYANRYVGAKRVLN